MKNPTSRLIFTPATVLITLCIIGVVCLLLSRFTGPTPKAHATGTDLGALSGYAWSENLGWISFSGSTYQVAVKSDGTLYGYAWANPSDDVSNSNNIGWIDFNAADTSGCGFGAATLTGTSITGGALVVSADNNGWNGCIDLNGSGYGTTLSSTGSSQSGSLDGYAWADNTVGGWISFNCDTGGPTANNICATSNYAVTYTTATAPPPPALSITSFTGPTRVRKGNTATLTYLVVSPPASCTITGSNGFTTTASPTDGIQGTVTPSPTITANTLFTMICGTASKTWTVGITPTVIEK